MLHNQKVNQLNSAAYEIEKGNIFLIVSSGMVLVSFDITSSPFIFI